MRTCTLRPRWQRDRVPSGDLSAHSQPFQHCFSLLCLVLFVVEAVVGPGELTAGSETRCGQRRRKHGLLPSSSESRGHFIIEPACRVACPAVSGGPTNWGRGVPLGAGPRQGDLQQHVIPNSPLCSRIRDARFFPKPTAAARSLAATPSRLAPFNRHGCFARIGLRTSPAAPSCGIWCWSCGSAALAEHG